MHTAFDGRGNAYTTLFLDSQVVKWNVEAAIKFHAGDKTAKYVVDRLDVQYQPGHAERTQSRNHRRRRQVLYNVGCKFSKDRFLPVGRCTRERTAHRHLGRKMVLLADHPVRGEPHDFIIFKRDLVRPKQVQPRRLPLAIKDPKESGVFPQWQKVTVKMTSQAPRSACARVQSSRRGDEVTDPDQPGQDRRPDARLFAIPNYNVNFIVNPLETKSVTFIADKPGVFWCYCTHFCHALHLRCVLA